MSDSRSTASRICLGTAQIGFDYGVANTGGRPDDAACDAIFSTAVDRGVLRWDTARAYGDAEKRIGDFLAGCSRRDEVQIVSKLPSPATDLSPAGLGDWVTTEVNSSLRDLRCERLAGWLIHDSSTVRTYGDAIWDAMQAQVDRGLVDRIGISVYDQNELRMGLDQPRLGAVQLTMNLFDHRFSEARIIGECQRRDITVYVRSVLLQGVFTLPVDRLPVNLQHLAKPLVKLHEILSRYDASPLDVALPFVLSTKQIGYTVIGVDDVSQLEDNLARAEQRLTDGLAEELCTAFRDLPVEVLEPRRW